MKQTLQEKNHLAMRLSGYAASAGALLVLSPIAKGGVVYSGLQNLEVNMPAEYLEVDLDGDLVNDFGFYMYGSSYLYSYGSIYFRYRFGYGVIINPKTDGYNNSWMTHSVLIRSYYNTYYGTTYQASAPIVHGLEAGVVVDNSQTMWSDLSFPMWPGALGVGTIITYYGPIYGSSYYARGAGDFIGQEHFIGVRFYIGTQQHYGWIRLSLGNQLEPMTIVDWAYEDVPGVGIETGDAAGADVVAPEVQFSGVGVAVNTATQVLTITFNEEITGFELGDIMVYNGSAANLIEVTAGLEYTVEVTAGAEGMVEVEIGADAVNDLAGNGNNPTYAGWLYDGTPPDVIIDSGIPTVTQDQTIPVSIEFSEEVSGLELGDFIVTNGSAANLVEIVPGMEYTIDVTAGVEGDVTVGLPAGAVTDIAGNENASASTTYTYDDPAVTDLTELSNAEINIYPNPVKGNLHVELENASILRIVNLNGTLLYQQDNVLDEIIDMSGFAPGVYILQIKNDNGVTRHRLIIE